VRSPLLVTDAWETSNAENVVVRASLGLTLYLDEPQRWASELISRLLERVLAFVNPAWLSEMWTSQDARWRTASDLMDVRSAIASRFGRPRHLLEVRLADDRSVPRLGITYREVDGRGDGPCAFLQLVLPVDSEPAELQALAMELVHEYPFLSGVGGYVFSWNPAAPLKAFHLIGRYTRRYLGLDVQTPHTMSWEVRDGLLPSVNWLTLIGQRALAEAPLPRLSHPEVTEFQGPRGVLIRAGDQPATVDLNMMEHSSAMAYISAALAPYLVPVPPPFPHTFGAETDRENWMRRLHAPEHWA